MLTEVEVMLEFVRQCSSIAREVAQAALARGGDTWDEEHGLAHALATLYDGLLEIHEEYTQ